MDNGFQYATWDDAAEDYINDILERLRDTHPACVLPLTWQQLRETISAALDDLDTSAEPWPDDPDGKLWDEYIDKIMEALRAEIEQALQDWLGAAAVVALCTVDAVLVLSDCGGRGNP